MIDKIPRLLVYLDNLLTPSPTGCQIILSKELDNIEVKLPPSTR